MASVKMPVEAHRTLAELASESGAGWSSTSATPPSPDVVRILRRWLHIRQRSRAWRER